MKINENSVVVLTYHLSITGDTDEENEPIVVEVVDENDPLYVFIGNSGLPPKFEEELIGLDAGDTFDFTIESADGYGDVDPEAIVELPKTLFDDEAIDLNEILVPGNIIPMTNEEGHRLKGQVVEVKSESVILDFNHPLSGRDMHFAGKIVSVREATADEIAHGHIHGDGGVQH